uniref:Uncharacterized protein n=1 Tax=Kalmanozyma brasiliensis (strain GHG001) TaxID=1365824 RepID=V5EJT9_KALBG
MSQSTPTAVAKRKVMGRMDAAPSESPSSSVTPNARPRIVRAQHGYSSPSFSNNVTPTATRPAPGTGRARSRYVAFYGWQAGLRLYSWTKHDHRPNLSALAHRAVHSDLSHQIRLHGRYQCLVLPARRSQAGRSHRSELLTLAKGPSKQWQHRFGPEFARRCLSKPKTLGELAACLSRSNQIARTASRSVTVSEAIDTLYVGPIYLQRTKSKSAFAAAISGKSRPSRHQTTEQISLAEVAASFAVSDRPFILSADESTQAAPIHASFRAHRAWSTGIHTCHCTPSCRKCRVDQTSQLDQ